MGDGPGKADTYTTGDRVFAKLKGYPFWPAFVQERVQGKEEKYSIHFYGTYDSAQIKVQLIHPYNNETIAKYGKPSKPSALFKKAMDEIEQHLVLYEQRNEPTEPEPLDSADEGELRIDETPPPVLKREGKISTSKSTPKEPAPKQPPRRISKASKRDSVGPASGGQVSSPINETPPAPPEPLISRSGRKIKPKRFADDEIGSPVSILAKAALQSSSADDGPPAAKRAKRQKLISSPAPALTPVPAAAAPPPPPPETTTTTTRPPPKQEVMTKGKHVAKAPVNTQKTLKTLTPVSPVKPNLVPVQPLPVKAESPSPSLPDSESGTPALSRTDEEEPFEDDLIGEEANDNGEDIEDKENSTGSWVNHHVREDSGSDDSSSCKNEDIKIFTEIPVSPDESSGEPFKVSFVKKEMEAEIFFSPKKAQELRSARVDFDLESAKLCLKLRQTLENVEPAAVELFNLLAEEVTKKEDEMRNLLDKTMRDKRAEKLKILRLEGEVIEIVGDIINSLNAKSADCYRAIELLDRLANHKLNTLILKKHPEVVETIRKLRYYEGNAEAWDLSSEELEEFNEKALVIREKAMSIYESFKLLFCPTLDRPFRHCFEEELEKFKEYCNSVSQADFLHMTEEPSSIAAEDLGENEENGDEEAGEHEDVGDQEEDEEALAHDEESFEELENEDVEENLEEDVGDEDDMEMVEGDDDDDDDEGPLVLDDNGQNGESEPET